MHTPAGRHPRAAAVAATTVVAIGIASGCTGSSSTPPSSSPTRPAAPATVWLCRPGVHPDPCTTDLTTTVVRADGATSTVAAAASSSGHDAQCFYVYPTVSGESGSNADLRIQPAEKAVATAQAARFSSVCDVWAPIYRQRTVAGLLRPGDFGPNSTANRIAFTSVEQGWRAFLAAIPAGRPIVVIGHSQGASMLVRLLRTDVDPDPALRHRLALAIVLGANATVATGRRTGGSFHAIPACSRPGQPGCVVAYSSFPGPPPALAFFGRPGFGVSALTGDVAASDRRVICVNPARIGGGRAPLHPYFPSRMLEVSASTPWTSYPDRYTAQCRTGGGASWLQVTPTHVPGDRRPLLRQSLGPLWGFHVADVNIALGDLVHDVAAAVTGWRRRGPA